MARPWEERISIAGTGREKACNYLMACMTLSPRKRSGFVETDLDFSNTCGRLPRTWYWRPTTNWSNSSRSFFVTISTIQTTYVRVFRLCMIASPVLDVQN